MTESDIELMAIEQLEGMGYTYVYGPEIESKGSNPLRSYKQVILEAKVLEALQRLNLNRTGFVGDFLFKLGHLT